MSASATLPAAPATFAQVYHDLETLLLQNTDDLRRVHDEITSLLRIMQEPDIGILYCYNEKKIHYLYHKFCRDVLYYSSAAH